MLTIYELATRLILSVILGGFLGWERQKSKKPASSELKRGESAGLKTHILVSLGSAVFTIISFAAIAEMKNIKVSGTFDPTRIAAGIITGIGFLGAGAIIRSRENVIGLTTAASIWVVAGIGMACGFGLYALAIVAAILVVLTLIVLEKIEERTEEGKLLNKKEE